MCSPSARFRFLTQFALAVVMILLGGWPPAAHALDTVTLQLKWSHAFQFAGYYTAKEKGYYREAGLDVAIQEAHPGDDPLKNVLDGKAQYGVGNSSLLLARKSGHPVVVLAAIFQHSPLVLIARARGQVQGIHDLAGKRLMIEPQSDELLAYLKQEGIPLAGIARIEHSFRPQDLIDGKVDAMSAYVTNEPYFLDRAGFAYHTYTPRSIGIDFYGDNLFTTEQELRSHPAQVEAFREATLRGWQYAMAHPEEIVDLILAKYSQQHTREFYLFEAKRMVPLFRTDLIEIGYMNPGRWRHIADTYADLGLLPRNFPLDGFVFNATSERDLTWLYLVGILLAIVSAVTLYIHRINRRLTQALVSSKQDHELLRVSEERHRLLADNATDVIWMMSLDGRFTYVSPSVKKLRGYTSAEVMQQSLEQALTAASMPIATKALGDSITAMAAGKPFVEFRGELEQPCKDGSTVWTEVTTSGMQNAAGEFIGILGVTRNITERKQAEERLQGLLREQQVIFENAHVGICMVRRRQIVKCNQRLAEMFGYEDPDELEGKLTEIFYCSPQEFKDVDDRAYADLLRHGFAQMEVRMRRRDGNSIWIMLSGRPLNVAEVLDGSIWIYTDITELKKAEAELLQHRNHLEELVFSRTAELTQARDDAQAANRAKSIFLATMSHEMRTPMNGVMGTIDLVLRRATDPKQIDWLNKSMDSAKHLLDVINDVLDISQIEAERLTLKENNFSLTQVFEDTIQMQGDAAKAKGLRLSCEISPALPDQLCGDATRLKQVLINFIGNAIKFSERGKITVSANAIEEDNHSVLLRIEVTDQGIGISPEQQNRLFHAFTQADGSMTRKYGGTGLGLIISKRIAQLMGGDAGVRSKEANGSTFWATVRLKKDTEITVASSGENADAEALIRQHYSGIRILVADAEPLYREVVQIQLVATGLIVDTAEDGAEAIALTHGAQYAAIFMDMQMPNVNGLDATRQIRQVPGYSDIRIIAMTANVSDEDKAQCAAAGMNDFLTKPFTPAELFAALLRSLSRRES